MNKDRIKGMILGGALGDALGAPHEFHNQKKNYDGVLDKCIYFKFQYTPIRNSTIGQVTDDTEMTFALYAALIKNGGIYDAETVIFEYMNWAESAWALGKNTRTLFKNIKTIKGYRERQSKLTADNQSNGSLMRCSPLALLGEDWKNDVREDCRLTNPSPVNIHAELLYVKALRMALAGKSKKEIIQEIVKRATEYKIPEVSNALHHATFKDKPWDLTENKGWVLHAFYCAMWGFIHFDDYKSAIDAIILRYGDCDTNAAIAGNLLGAYYGYDKMIENPITKKNIKVLLKCDPSKGDMPRKDYAIDNLGLILRELPFT